MERMPEGVVSWANACGQHTMLGKFCIATKNMAEYKQTPYTIHKHGKQHMQREQSLVVQSPES